MSRVPRILLAGFEPFGADPTNPSWDAVAPLQGACIGGHRVETRCLPVAFETALTALRQALDAVRPRLVLCVGLAGGREGLSLERVAINVIDARIADNLGAQPVDAPVVEGGPAAYFSRLPIKAMRAALQAQGLPAHISQTAGTYVCNQVFYGACHLLRRRRGVRAGLIHVPYSPVLAALHPGQPALAVETVTQALRICLEVALVTSEDLILAGGAEH